MYLAKHLSIFANCDFTDPIKELEITKLPYKILLVLKGHKWLASISPLELRYIHHKQSEDD